MKLSDCLKEGQPKVALLRKKSWTENKSLLRYGKMLEYVTAWNSKEDFILTVDDLFANDWEIAGYCDLWHDTENRVFQEAINKCHEKSKEYGVNIISEAEYITKVEAHSIKEAYALALNFWENDVRPFNDSHNFDLNENIAKKIEIYDGDTPYEFNVEEMENEKRNA